MTQSNSLMKIMKKKISNSGGSTMKFKQVLGVAMSIVAFDTAHLAYTYCRDRLWQKLGYKGHRPTQSPPTVDAELKDTDQLDV